MIDSYESVVLFSGILGMYARYNFMQGFREKASENLRFEIILYGMFYIVSTSIYFIYDIPIVNLLIQIVFLMIIGCVMGMGLKKALLSTAIILVVLLVLDGSIYFLTGYVSESPLIKAEYSSMFGIVSVDLLALLASNGFKKYKNVKRSVDIPTAYWISIFVFPIMSLGLLLIIFEFSKESRSVAVVGSLMILLMNLVIIALYDSQIVQYEKKVDQIALNYMNMSYQKQLELMRVTMERSESFRHDIKKHFASIKTLALERQYEDLDNYIEEVTVNIKEKHLISSTGNILVDSIINFEVNNSNANPDFIEIMGRNIPEKLDVKDYDLTIVLSNMVSNALNALEKIENGAIEIYIEYKKGALIIKVKNDFDGQVLVKGNNKLVTTNENKDTHGYGIENIKRVIELYNGYMSMEYTDKRFKIDIIMYERV